jgi:iron complex outermembrane receptor protein
MASEGSADDNGRDDIMLNKSLTWAALLTSSALAFPAFSQTTGAPIPQAGAAQDEPAGSSGDIIVTAQRRGQNLQDVPITMSAVSAATLETAGVSSTVDLPAVTPGLSMTATRNGITPYLRGIGTQSSTAEQAVAIYIDNVYIASTAAAAFSLNNVERVEVLKGPQGTLFGRNATGGLINVITRDPSHTPELDVTGSYGNYQTYSGSLYATTGLTENIAMDIAGYGNYQTNGWGKNVFLNEDVNLSRSYALRSKIQGVFGGTKVTVSGDYNYTRSDFGNARQIARGSLAAGGIRPLPSLYDISSALTSNVNRPTKQWGGSLKIDQEISDKFSLTNTVAYRNNKFPSCTDSDTTSAVGIDGCFKENSNTFQEELLLNGQVGRLQITGGLFYYHYVRGEQPLIVFSAIPARQSYRYTNITTDSYAAFGQFTYALTDRTNLTAGLRYTKEDSEAEGVIRSGTTATGPITFDTATRTDGVSNNSTDRKLTWRFSLDHRFSPDLLAYASVNRGFKSGSYNPFAINDAPTRPETLDSYEVGIKSDFLDRQVRLNLAAFYYDYKDIQVSTILLVGTGDRNAASARIKGLDGEIVFAPHVSVGRFEIRASGTYLDTEYVDYTNALANVPNVIIGGVPFTGAPLCARANAGQSTAGTLTGGNSTCTIDASGKLLAKSPKFSSSLSVDYDIPVSENLKLGFGMNWQHMGRFFWDPANYYANSSYELVNGQISLASQDDRWRVRMFGRNLTNTPYYSQVGPSASSTAGAAGAPRTYGVAFDLKFGGR